MLLRRILSVAVICAIMPGGLLIRTAHAADLRITLPKAATTTPVQQLNREGVDAINKHHVAKAKRLFYQAYLLDPDDPFTLNNLGYISELEGSVDRAQRFYPLAREQSFGALVRHWRHQPGKSRPGVGCRSSTDLCRLSHPRCP